MLFKENLPAIDHYAKEDLLHPQQNRRSRYNFEIKDCCVTKALLAITIVNLSIWMSSHFYLTIFSPRSPIWLQGGKAHGPKGPTTHFYMLPYHLRVFGLIHTLSSKFAQVSFIRHVFSSPL